MMHAFTCDARCPVDALSLEYRSRRSLSRARGRPIPLRRTTSTTVRARCALPRSSQARGNRSPSPRSETNLRTCSRRETFGTERSVNPQHPTLQFGRVTCPHFFHLADVASPGYVNSRHVFESSIVCKTARSDSCGCFGFFAAKYRVARSTSDRKFVGWLSSSVGTTSSPFLIGVAWFRLVANSRQRDANSDITFVIRILSLSSGSWGSTQVEIVEEVVEGEVLIDGFSTPYRNGDDLYIVGAL